LTGRPALAAFHQSREDLPAEIAVFPLSGALLLPQGRLPLNIFEPRYLAMVEDSLASGRLFGMVQPDPSLPPGPNGPFLYRVGCLGRLASFAETDDGRFLITLIGVARFRIGEELESRRGYRRVRVDYSRYLGDLELDRPAAEIDRAALIGALRPYFRARQIDANWEAIDHTPDAMLVTTLAMVCPFDVREKQALLEASTTAERASMLVAIMQMETLGGAAPEGRPS
jgi:hypothetical protein